LLLLLFFFFFFFWQLLPEKRKCTRAVSKSALRLWVTAYDKFYIVLLCLFYFVLCRIKYFFSTSGRSAPRVHYTWTVISSRVWYYGIYFYQVNCFRATRPSSVYITVFVEFNTCSYNFLVSSFTSLPILPKYEIVYWFTTKHHIVMNGHTQHTYIVAAKVLHGTIRIFFFVTNTKYSIACSYVNSQFSSPKSLWNSLYAS